MRTRGLRLEISDEGVFSYPKYSDYNEYEKRKIRKIYGTKINEALLKSFFEIKSRLKDSDANASRFNADHSNKLFKLNNDDSERYVKNISDKICNLCYDEYSANSRLMKRKLFEICSNIKRDSNAELREKILLRKMSISELITADTLELAPQDIREKRKKEIEHHYIRNVILKPNVGNEDSKHDEQTNDDYSPSLSLSRQQSLRSESSIADLKRFFSESSANNSPDVNRARSGTSGSNTVNRSLSGSDSFNESLRTISSNSGSISDMLFEYSDGKIIINTSTRRRKVLSESEDFEKAQEEAFVKLASPPRCENYKFEAVSLRILKRIEALPGFVSRPFVEPFNAATKRIQLLMQRSSILNKKIKVL